MDTLDGFIDWFVSIPPIIWSGAIGALLASAMSYVGIRSANQSSLKRLHAQHQYDRDEAVKQRSHDAQQKEEDRKAAIRREVYTEAVEEVHAVLAVIGGLPMKPLNMSKNNDSDGLQAFLKANAKVWLVAEVDAAHLSRELTSQMGEVYFKALSSAYPLRLAYEPMWDMNRKLAYAHGEVQRTNLRVAELNENMADFYVREAAEKSRRDANDMVALLKASNLQILNSLAPQYVAYTKKLFHDMQAVQQTIVKLVSSLRKELHLPPDELEFLAQHADMEKRALTALNRAFGIVD